MAAPPAGASLLSLTRINFGLSEPPCIRVLGAPVYMSEQFQRLMADHGILLDEPLRQRLGQCYDGELLLLAQDRADGPQGLQDEGRSQGGCVRLQCIERFYNPKRRHSTLGYLSPVEIEERRC
jgi:putative transposase